MPHMRDNYIKQYRDLRLILTIKVPPFTKLMHHGAFYSPLLVPLLFYPKLFRNMLTDERLDENKMVSNEVFKNLFKTFNLG